MLRWDTLLLLVPVAVLSLAIPSAAILPFPLLGFLLVPIIDRLVGRGG